MIRELACALLLFAGAVHATSTVCSLNHRCVYYELCVDGFINTDGTGLIDPRSPKPVPADVPYDRCEKVGTVCCRHPDNPDGPDVVVDPTCPFHHRCVANALCINGEINTSGIGLLDVRINNQQLDCTNPEYSSVPAVCCRDSKPADSCPVTHNCVPTGQCNGVTTDPKGSYIGCYLDATQTEVGVCCDPLGVRETCSSDGSVKCLQQDQCSGTISTHDSGNYVECYLSSQSTGVCCNELPPADEGCGVRHYNLDTRIKNTNLLAYQAEFAEFPWQSIIFFTNFTFKCGGSLIGNQWLLTGAHCVHGFQPQDFQVRLGEWQVDKYDEPGQYHDVGVEAITIHPDFNSKNLHNDIAVIKLSEYVPFKYHINTICLPKAGQLLPPGTRCFATGWGKTAFDGGEFQVILKKVDLPLVDYGICQENLRKTRLGYEFILDKSFLCAGGEEGNDACTGDGGGPLACEDPHTGRYFLAGITAWGIGCGEKDVPGVYVDVQYFQNWVYQITGISV